MTASLCLAATAAVTATHLAAVIDCESEREVLPATDRAGTACRACANPGALATFPSSPPSLQTFVIPLTDDLKENSFIFLLKVVKIPQITPSRARTD